MLRGREIESKAHHVAQLFFVKTKGLSETMNLIILGARLILGNVTAQRFA